MSASLYDGFCYYNQSSAFNKISRISYIYCPFDMGYTIHCPIVILVHLPIIDIYVQYSIFFIERTKRKITDFNTKHCQEMKTIHTSPCFCLYDSRRRALFSGSGFVHWNYTELVLATFVQALDHCLKVICGHFAHLSRSNTKFIPM